MKHKKLIFFVATAILSLGIVTPLAARKAQVLEPDAADYEDELVVDYDNPEMRYIAPKRAASKASSVKIHYHNEDKNCLKKELWLWGDGIVFDKALPYDKGGTNTDIVFTIPFTGAYADFAKKKSLWFIVKYQKGTQDDEWMGKSDNTEIVFEERPIAEDGSIEVWCIPGEGSALEVYNSEIDTTMDRVQNAIFNSWKGVTAISTIAPKAYRLYALTGSYMRMGQAEQQEKLGNYLIAQGSNPKCTTVAKGKSFAGSKQFKISLNYTIKPNAQYYLECDFENPNHSEWGMFTKGKYVAAHPLYDTKEFTTYYNYKKNDLGATYNGPESTTFRVWAPTAARVRLCLYQSGTPEKYNEEYEGVNGSDDYGGYSMVFRPGGIWEVTITGKDLKNTYYNYYVVNSLGENIATDPYAKACGVNGDRGMVVDWNETNPEGWDDVPTKWDGKDGYDIAYPNDLSIYECHIRDLTMHSSWNGTEANRGTFLGFVESGTKCNGLTTGFDHIREMGVKAVQLVPVFDHDNVEDPKNQSFNWGYNPKNYNCVEGSYSTDPFTGTTRIKEYKQLIKAFADPSGSQHTRIVMDVVYNHVSSATESCFHKLMPRYYFRYTDNGDFWNGSGCGNDVKTEAPMMRKYIVDSLRFWATEYKIKGFRFDLMGLIDYKTMQEAVKELYKVDPDIYLYGEGWAAGGTGDMGKDNWGTNTWTIYEKFQRVDSDKTCWLGGFNNAGRNALKGDNNFDNKEEFNGFITTEGGGGKAQVVADMAIGYHTGNNGGEDGHKAGNLLDPNMCIVYASCHDNFTLFDQFSGSYIGGDDGTAAAATAAAECYVLASNGVAFIQGGEEIFRSKVVKSAKDKALGAKDSVNINGKTISHNSYNLSDEVNAFDWNRKKTYENKYNAIKTACNLRNSLTRYNKASIVSMNPWYDNNTAPLQVYTSCGRSGGYPIWDGATSVAYKNNHYTFVLGGRNSQYLGVPDGAAVRYATNYDNDRQGYNGSIPNVSVWGYTTVCFEK